MEKAMAPHSSTLAWKIPWTEEPGGLQSMGSLRVGLDWTTSLSLFNFHALEKEMATLSSVLAWRIPGTGEPGGLPSMGSHRGGHDWSDLAAAAAWMNAFHLVYGRCPSSQTILFSSVLKSTLIPELLQRCFLGFHESDHKKHNSYFFHMRNYSKQDLRISLL